MTREPRRRLAAAVAALTALTLLTAPAAQAESRTLRDPAGDAYGNRLDITRVRVDNEDRGVRVTISFTQVGKGNAFFSLQDRRTREERIYFATFRGDDGPEKVGYLLPEERGRFTCRGLTARWSPRRDDVTVTIARSCLPTPGTGAVRVIVGTEPPGGADSDRTRRTSWIERD
ncbi:hypothetical protein [Nocardioides sp.]|uniref:hypothetical protein n=1 Tax=Nocardioides sp. TaxID=35761 RepID=UPI0035150CE9